jgi:DNA-binding transcriptional MerR regulator
MMNITKRTLQTYKDKGLLPYSKLNRKIIINARMYRLCSKPDSRTIPMKMDLFEK